MIKTIRRVSMGLMVSVSLIAFVDALRGSFKFKSGVSTVKPVVDSWKTHLAVKTRNNNKFVRGNGP